MSGGPRRRLDAELVRRGLAPSRARAAELVEGGEVYVNGAVATKPARQVLGADAIVLAAAAAPFVSRAGHKLDHALDHFGIDVGGLRCLDAGASTGGFSDCLLQRGAASVVALDVGYGQLHERLRRDPRIDVRERSNLRDVEVGDVAGPFDLVTADLSFISLGLVMERLVALAGASGQIVVLVKPQFEAGKAEADRGRGVIRDAAVWRSVLVSVIERAEEAGVAVGGLAGSPLRGASGNVEFLLWLVPAAGSTGRTLSRSEVEVAITSAVDRADGEAAG